MESRESSPARRNQAARGMSIQIQFLEPGTRLLLRNGATVEVVANPADGGWLFVRYLTSPNPTEIGEEAMLHASEFSEVLDDA